MVGALRDVAETAHLLRRTLPVTVLRMSLSGIEQVRRVSYAAHFRVTLTRDSDIHKTAPVTVVLD